MTIKSFRDHARAATGATRRQAPDDRDDHSDPAAARPAADAPPAIQRTVLPPGQHRETGANRPRPQPQTGRGTESPDTLDSRSIVQHYALSLSVDRSDSTETDAGTRRGPRLSPENQGLVYSRAHSAETANRPAPDRRLPDTSDVHAYEDHHEEQNHHTRDDQDVERTVEPPHAVMLAYSPELAKSKRKDD
jgi:hypothetical protein